MNSTISENQANHTLHYQLNIIKYEDAIRYSITSSNILLFLYLILIIGYSERFLTKASYVLCIGVWVVWMLNTVVFFVLVIDINKQEWFSDAKNNIQIVNASLILIQCTFFIMHCVWHRYDEVAMGKVKFTRLEEEDEKLNNI